MKTKLFIEKYEPCREGAKFAKQYKIMTEVWDNCQRPDWLFWILRHHAPLTKEQCVILAIEVAESCIDNYTGNSDAPRRAIDAAKAYLNDPSVTAESAALAAASAAEAEATESVSEAWSVALAAAESAESAESAVAAAESAESAAEAVAARSAAARSAAARSAAAAEAQCDAIRRLVDNPFNN